MQLRMPTRNCPHVAHSVTQRAGIFSSWAGVGRQDEDKVSTDERVLKAFREGLGC